MTDEPDKIYDVPDKKPIEEIESFGEAYERFTRAEGEERRRLLRRLMRLM